MKFGKWTTRLAAAALAAAITAAGAPAASAQASAPAISQRQYVASAADAHFFGDDSSYYMTSIGSGSVNAYNGNLYWSYYMNFYQTGQLPTTMYYNSQDSADIGFGNHVRMEYTRSIQQTAADRYIYTEDNGKVYDFEMDPQTRKFTDCLGRELIENSDGTVSIKALYDYMYTFDAQGRLIRIHWGSDLEPAQEITYSLSGHIEKVQNTYGNKFYLEYSYVGYNDRTLCTKIQTGYGDMQLPGSSYRLQYDSKGNLTAVGIDPTLQDKFSYDANGNLSCYERSSGSKTNYTYTNIGGIDRVTYAVSTSKDGTVQNSCQFAYGDHQTIIIDHTGTVSVVRFDENGQVIS